MSPSYRHRQPGTLIWVFSGIAMVLIGVFLGQARDAWVVLLIIELVLALVLLLFHSLSVEVDRKEIRLAFGIGLIHRRIPLERIASVAVIRPPWYYGWGIRKILHGWMWNISGLNGVQLNFSNGRRFVIGSDQAPQLAAAIEAFL